MRVPAVVFNPERVHCPSCFQPYDRAGASCTRCGFSLQVACAKFPFAPPEIERIIDPEEAFTARDRRLVEKAVARFERHFPGIRVAVHPTRLPEGADVREFGFWLFNQAPLAEGEAPEDRAGTLLLILDRHNRQAGLTVGYELDPFIGDDTGNRCLAAGKKDFEASDYGRGVVAFLGRLDELLAHQSVPALENAERFRRSPRPDLHTQP